MNADSALQYEQPVAIRYPRGSGEGINIKENPNFIVLVRLYITRRPPCSIISDYRAVRTALMQRHLRDQVFRR